MVQQYPSYSPKQTLWLLFKEKRTAGEQQFVQSLLEQSAVIARTYETVRQFRQILTERDESALPRWASEAEASQPDSRTAPVPPEAAHGLGSGRKCPLVRD